MKRHTVRSRVLINIFCGMLCIVTRCGYQWCDDFEINVLVLCGEKISRPCCNCFLYKMGLAVFNSFSSLIFQLYFIFHLNVLFRVLKTLDKL